MGVRSRVLLLACFVGIVVSASPAGAQRLPAGATPVHYDLRLEPDLQAATFAGRVAIDVLVAVPTSTFVLNAHELTIRTAAVEQAGVGQPASVQLDAGRQQLTLRTARPIAAGPARLQLAFDGTLNEQLAGFYLGRSGDRRYAATHFEPTHARRAFPCFDEPAMKATFDVALVLDSRDRAISNGRIVSDVPGPAPGTHTIRFETTKRMSTYLVAVVVGDIGCLEDAASGVALRVCGLGGRHERGRFAMEATKAFLTYFTDYYGIGYPFDKLDQIGIADFAAGGMENSGAILYRDALLLLDERTASLQDRRAVANLIAHEIAHQWFGNLVTMRWWDDLWLKEGVATWAAGKATAHWKPEWETALTDAIETSYAIRADSVASTRPVKATESETPAEIGALFNVITYMKAAAVLRMLEQFVGEAAFRQGIRTYLTAHAYGNASASDLWGALAGASTQPVERVMTGYIEQPGTPLLSVSARCDEGSRVVTLRQQRFFIDASSREAGSGERWVIPVCFKAGSGATACELLTEPIQTVRLAGCEPWTLANASGRGYYVTSYADGALGPLAKAGRLTEPEWLRLMHDQIALVVAGRQPARVYLELAESLGHDHRADVLERGWGPLAFIGTQMTEAAERPIFDAWMRRLLRPSIERVGREPRPADSDDDRQLRAVVLRHLAAAGDAGTVTYLQDVADRYLADPAAVDPALAGLALETSARHGDAAFYDRVRKGLAGADAGSVRQRLEQALAHFTTPALLERTLQRSLTPELRTQDLPAVLYAALYEPSSRPQVWAFVKTHFAELRARLGSPGDTALASVVGAFCQRDLREDARAFFAANPIPGADAIVAQELESTAACIALREREAAGVANWLTARASVRESR
jgi:aminopeptidase N